MQIRKNEMSRNKIRSTVCIVLLVLNVFLAFYSIGAPKGKDRVNPHSYPAYVDSSGMGDLLRLNSDTVAITDDGEEFILESGYEMCAVEYLDDGSIRIYNSHGTSIEGCEDIYLTVKNADYEDVTEEVKANTARLNRQSQEKIREDIMKQIFWFIFPTAEGHFLVALISAVLIALVDGCCLKFAAQYGELRAFTVVNILVLAFLSGYVILYVL